jgi:hypothetical protein
MEKRFAGWVVCGLLMGAATACLAAQAGLTAAEPGPVALRVDNLKTPLGIDDPTPGFSWQLQDKARGACCVECRAVEPGKGGRLG